MQNLLTASQMREADAYTIAHEPIASIDLMERAAHAFIERSLALSLIKKDQSILICCGAGNNGGDGLAIARQLYEEGFSALHIWIIHYNERQSADFKTNLARIETLPISIQSFAQEDELPMIEQSLIIDAMLGSGLNKPLSGSWLKVVQHLNQAKKKVIAVDIPTGMPADGHLMRSMTALFAHEVISFQRPKINFLFPESAYFMKRFHVVDIGLNEDFIARQASDFYEITSNDARAIYKERRPFSHKGTYGHSLLIAGSEDTMGAALLCAEACLYTGSGLTSACIPKTGLTALNTRLPEVMAISREALFHQPLKQYTAMAVGPGLGKSQEISELMKRLLAKPAMPMVIDADALNVLAENQQLFDRLPPDSILTPHMKEFDRLFGEHSYWYDRVVKAREEAQQRKLIIVLKNQYTFIALPNGRILVNFTGNPAMASGGMGDALTGMLVALLAQGYRAEEAAILGCYLHGKSGDLLAETGMAVVPANVLIQNISKVMGNI
ncbi:bifunctional ADP-dependent NAD(P)H-hydrate dehydratase/NAD(P)H-hydrate epimerase [Olivibacter ginsenosidimutans]|uniref:Bifunctional NAD(P)H-hydrate repair enzyme n=1 Tax=Olivibacter ginsenosidimutans TaxID=1176537 RepID=A0ABP9BPA2_9SPHI